MKPVFSAGAIAVAAAVCGAFGVTLVGQSTSTDQPTLSALLTEVRGLRTAIEDLASAGPRVQLAVGRLQLQEQRVASVVRRADGLRDALQAAQKEAAPIQERLSLNLKILEQNVRPAERSDIEAQVAAERQRLARVMADVQRLQSEEQAATAEAVAEQQRWIAINAELETLDRSLRRRQ